MWFLKDIANAYYDFYEEHNSYNSFSLANAIDYFFNKPKLRTEEDHLIGGAGALEYVTAGSGGFIIKSLGVGISKNSSKILTFTTRQLQAKFKHAVDFGIKSKWNKIAASKFSSAINQHINSSGINIIKGTYRGNPAIQYLNPKSGLNVITKPNGTFISGWKLNANQLENVIKHGGL